MSKPVIHIKRLHPDAVIPKQGTPLASGFDLHALDVVRPADVISPYNGDFECWTMGPGERVLVRTGIALALLPNLEAHVRGRSGLALKHGIWVHFGTIDADYRGDVGVILLNEGDKAFTITKGDRIAQLVFAPVFHYVPMELTDELPDSDRGTGGYGSTGVAS